MEETITTTAEQKEQTVTPGEAFDTFLKTDGMQSEFDRRVTKALKTRELALGEETDAKIKEAVAEALKVAKMTADEKQKHEAQQAQEALAKREADITRRELRAGAVEALTAKGLPATLADTLSLTDQASVDKGIEALAQAFQASVQQAVDARLKGGRAPEKAQQDAGADLEKQIMSAMKGGISGIY